MLPFDVKVKPIPGIHIIMFPEMVAFGVKNEAIKPNPILTSANGLSHGYFEVT